MENAMLTQLNVDDLPFEINLQAYRFLHTISAGVWILKASLLIMNIRVRKLNMHLQVFETAKL